MNRLFYIAVGFIAVLSAVVAGQVRAQSIDVPLIGQTQAEQVGLKRAWFTQLPIDGMRTKIAHIKYQYGLLLVVTNGAMLHVVDAETGQLMWSFRLGDRKFGALTASANDTQIAVCNINRMFVLDRNTGTVLFTHSLSGTPARGPTLTKRHAMIPLVNGPIETYALDGKFDEDLGPGFLESAGRIIGELAAYDVSVLWTGDNNTFHAHEFGDVGSQFNEVVQAGITSGPAVFTPHAFVGTDPGYLLAYDALHGEIEWKFAAGSAIVHQPVALDKVVFVLPEDGGMFAVDPADGQSMWYARDPAQFISASPDRVYTVDRIHRIQILDAKTGARIDSLRMSTTLKAITNDKSDRMFFYTDNGLLQSVRETQLVQPHYYIPPKLEAPKNGPAAKGAGDEAAPAAVPDAAPAAAPDAAAGAAPGA